VIGVKMRYADSNWNESNFGSNGSKYPEKRNTSPYN